MHDTKLHEDSSNESTNRGEPLEALNPKEIGTPPFLEKLTLPALIIVLGLLLLEKLCTQQ